MCLSFRLGGLQRIASEALGEIEPDGWARARDYVKRVLLLWIIFVINVLRSCCISYRMEPQMQQNGSKR